MNATMLKPLVGSLTLALPFLQPFALRAWGDISPASSSAGTSTVTASRESDKSEASAEPSSSSALALMIALANRKPKEDLRLELGSSAAVPSLRQIQAWRQQARLLSHQGQWVAAASQWRDVVAGLSQRERLLGSVSTRSNQESQARSSSSRALSAWARGRVSTWSAPEKMLRAEAQRELRRAQSQLSAFWRVSNVVTLGADSRNPSPTLASRASAASAMMARSQDEVSDSGANTHSRRPMTAVSALALRAMAPSRRSRSLLVQSGREMRASVTLRSYELLRNASGAGATSPRLFARRLEAERQERVLRSLVAKQVSGTQGGAALMWAQAQWWARPVVQIGVDSRNPAQLNTDVAPSAARVAEDVPSLGMKPSTHSAHVSMSQEEATVIAQARLSPAPLEEGPRLVDRHSWTMMIHLPSAAEAAAAAAAPSRPANSLHR